MPSSKNNIYYLVKGKKSKKKGHRVDGVHKSIMEVAKNDPLRKKIEEKLKDDHFRTKVLGFKNMTAKEAIYDYRHRLENNVVPPDKTMCYNMYEIGIVKETKESKVLVEKKDGTEEWLDRDASEACTFDPQHEGPLDELPEDVSSISGFGVAALLIVIRRTLIEKMQQFTYVGDVVIAVNPYMYLPQMVRIAQPPEVKTYHLGKDPSVYATAHFSYWGLMKPEEYFVGCPRNQSCIVSGESGAGKTVSCGQIMRYLANMSDWSRGITRRASTGNVLLGTESSDAIDVTKLVRGVSPFLEAFGNANTVMNDNSSRFGKFQKILFNKAGRIIGGEVDHYLLEKGRLSYQGKGERNFHIFYFLLKGKTPEEDKLLRLKSAEKYKMLFGGGITTIRHENKRSKDGTIVNTYDVDRMNNPLDDDADHTGCRAALKAANVSEKRQLDMWKALAALLKMGDLEFEEDENERSSKVKNRKLCDEISALLGIDHLPEDEGLHKMLCIYRREIQGEKLDSPVSPRVASFQRFALIKDLYSRMFDELMRVVNRVLDSRESACGFIGILDIFGFEVFEYNSMEQLCINFANEKLQKLFNEHIFVEEGKIYKAEDLPLDVLPPFRDNTPCCNLIERKHVGIFPMLDDMVGKAKATDESYARQVFERYGFNAHKAGPSATTRAEKRAGEYIGGKQTDPMWFTIRHFAGNVRYHTKDWIKKNEDKLPPQLPDLMQSSKNEYISTYVFMKNGLPKEDRERVGRQQKIKPKKNTIACKFILSLRQLAKTLGKTNPHYVRCVKPNDVHMRPCDGRIAFDTAKTYRQLLYAGVMEVCKIKKEGYPFRETYERFWTERCVKNKWVNLMVPSLDPNMDPREGVTLMCKAVMPPPRLQGDKPHQVVRPTWVNGKTKLFGKDYTIDTFETWHKMQLSEMVQRWIRVHISVRERLREFTRSCVAIQLKYRSVLIRRKLAQIEAEMMRAASMLRACNARREYVYRREKQHAVQLIQHAHRHFWRWKKWDRTLYDLKRIEHVRAASIQCQRSWRNLVQYRVWAEALVRATRRDRAVRIVNAHRQYRSYLRWVEVEEALRKRDMVVRVVRAYRQFVVFRSFVDAYAMLVRKGSSYMLETMASMCGRRLAVRVIGSRVRNKMRSFRQLRVAQRLVRGCLARGRWAQLKKWFNTVKDATNKACALFQMKETRTFFFNCTRGQVVATDFYESIHAKAWIRDQIEAVVVIQRFIRGCLHRNYITHKLGAVVLFQQAYRIRRITRSLRARRGAVGVIEKIFYQTLMKMRCAQWIEQMQAVTAAGDLEEMMDMMNCPPPYQRLKALRHEKVPVGGGKKEFVEYNGLVNLRDRVFLSSFLHTATGTGNAAAVKYLLHQGADPESINIKRDTPVHFAAADGDRSIGTLSILMQGCNFVSRVNPKLLWILSHEAANVDGMTVLDKAIECEAMNANSVAYLRARQARFHPKIVDDAAKLDEARERLRLKSRASLLREETKSAKHREAGESFKYLMLSPESTDRRSARLFMTKSEIDADKKITGMFTAALAKAKFNAVLDGRTWRKNDDETRELFADENKSDVIRSTEDEKKKMERDAQLERSTMEKVQLMKEKIRERNLRRQLVAETSTNNTSGGTTKNEGISPEIRDRAIASMKKSEQLDKEMNNMKRIVDTAPGREKNEDIREKEIAAVKREWFASHEDSNQENDDDFDGYEEGVDDDTEIIAEDSKTTLTSDAAQLMERLEEERTRRIEMQARVEHLKAQVIASKRRDLHPIVMRNSMLKCLLALERLSSSSSAQFRRWGWEYLDAKGTIHGPYDTLQMRAWFVQGCFSRHLPIRYVTEANLPFISLSELFNPLETAFSNDSLPLVDLRSFFGLFFLRG